MYTLKDKLGRSTTNGFWMQVRDEEELSFVLMQLISMEFKGKLVSVERVSQKPSGEERLLMVFRLVDDPEHECVYRQGWLYKDEREKLEYAKRALTSRRNKVRYQEKKRQLAGP
jgi:hypothetical protein